MAERVPPKKYGGTERVVHALTEELVRRGHDVTQHIHSLRARGVMSCHRLATALFDAIASLRSFGSGCTVPPAMLALMRL